MTAPSGMYRTSRTARSLNVLIFTVTPSVKKEGRGGTRRRYPCRDAHCYAHRLRCIHATRRRIAEKFGHDLAAIIEDAHKRQAASGREIWRLKPKAPIAKPDVD